MLTRCSLHTGDGQMSLYSSCAELRAAMDQWGLLCHNFSPPVFFGPGSSQIAGRFCFPPLACVLWRLFLFLCAFYE